MQIGAVGKKLALTVAAIRFYERNGLLPRAPRTAGGFRRYGDSDIERLSFIRRTQGLGFTLAEIRGLLALRDSRLRPCASVRRRLQGKLADVRHKLADLRKLEHELRLALLSCDREVRKQDAHCPILRERNFTEAEGQEMKIEVLYVLDCPSHRAAVKLVRDVLASQGLTADVEEVLVSNQRMAVDLKFHGSPAIRINGRDIAGELSAGHVFGLSCRLYPGSQQIGLPPAEIVSRAVAEAAEGGGK